MQTMPRTYIKKGRKNQWSDDQLQAAMGAVQSKELRAAAAAHKYGIPPSTLRDHFSGKSSRRYGGPGTILTTAEEKEIERVCQTMQELGFPLTKEFVSMALQDYLVDTGRADKFKQGMPGYDWWSGFFKRHAHLVEQKPQHLQQDRARAARPAVKIFLVFRTVTILRTSMNL